MTYGEWLKETDFEATPETYRDWKGEDNSLNLKDSIESEVDSEIYWY